MSFTTRGPRELKLQVRRSNLSPLNRAKTEPSRSCAPWMAPTRLARRLMQLNAKGWLFCPTKPVTVESLMMLIVPRGGRNPRITPLQVVSKQNATAESVRSAQGRRMCWFPVDGRGGIRVGCFNASGGERRAGHPFSHRYHHHHPLALALDWSDLPLSSSSPSHSPPLALPAVVACQPIVLAQVLLPRLIPIPVVTRLLAVFLCLATLSVGRRPLCLSLILVLFRSMAPMP